MLEFLDRLLQPGIAACLAVVLVAVGLEVDEPGVTSALEIAGAVLAAIAWVLRVAGVTGPGA